MFCWVYITGNMEYVILTALYPKQVVQWKPFKNLFKKPIQELSLHWCIKHDYWMLCWEVITCDINCWHFTTIWAIFELWTSTTSENNWTFTTFLGWDQFLGESGSGWDESTFLDFLKSPFHGLSNSAWTTFNKYPFLVLFGLSRYWVGQV